MKGEDTIYRILSGRSSRDGWPIWRQAGTKWSHMTKKVIGKKGLVLHTLSLDAIPVDVYRDN